MPAMEQEARLAVALLPLGTLTLRIKCIQIFLGLISSLTLLGGSGACGYRPNRRTQRRGSLESDFGSSQSDRSTLVARQY
jgi:hypothetical protein